MKISSVIFVLVASRNIRIFDFDLLEPNGEVILGSGRRNVRWHGLVELGDVSIPLLPRLFHAVDDGGARQAHLGLADRT